MFKLEMLQLEMYKLEMYKLEMKSLPPHPIHYCQAHIEHSLVPRLFLSLSLNFACVNNY